MMTIDAYVQKAERCYVLHIPEEEIGESHKKGNRFIEMIRQYLPKKDRYNKLFKKAQETEKITVVYPAELDLEEAISVYQGIIDKRVKRHKTYMTINSALLAITFPTPIPLITIFFGYLVAKSAYNMNNAKLSMEKVKLIPDNTEGLEERILEEEI
ncbi:MAG: hypothetical protein V1729_02910 [Candidatus Woesearchaeota archaeon]